MGFFVDVLWILWKVRFFGQPASQPDHFECSQKDAGVRGLFSLCRTWGGNVAEYLHIPKRRARSPETMWLRHYCRSETHQPRLSAWARKQFLQFSDQLQYFLVIAYLRPRVSSTRSLKPPFSFALPRRLTTPSQHPPFASIDASTHNQDAPFGLGTSPAASISGARPSLAACTSFVGFLHISLRAIERPSAIRTVLVGMDLLS